MAWGSGDVEREMCDDIEKYRRLIKQAFFEAGTVGGLSHKDLKEAWKLSLSRKLRKEYNGG